MVVYVRLTPGFSGEHVKEGRSRQRTPSRCSSPDMGLRHARREDGGYIAGGVHDDGVDSSRDLSAGTSLTWPATMRQGPPPWRAHTRVYR